jgi:hypothetical protein
VSVREVYVNAKAISTTRKGRRSVGKEGREREEGAEEVSKVTN